MRGASVSERTTAAKRGIDPKVGGATPRPRATLGAGTRGASVAQAEPMPTSRGILFSTILVARF